MESRPLLIAAASLVLTMVLATALMGREMSTSDGSQPAVQPGSGQVGTEPVPVEPGTVDAAQGAVAGTQPAPGTAASDPSAASGATEVQIDPTVALGSAETAVKSCHASTGAYSSCREVVGPDVRVISTAPDSITLANPENTHLLRISASESCRYVPQAPTNCAGW